MGTVIMIKYVSVIFSCLLIFSRCRPADHIVEVELPRHGRLLLSPSPNDRSDAVFRLPPQRREDDFVVLEAAINGDVTAMDVSDGHNGDSRIVVEGGIPKDNSGTARAGLRLLPSSNTEEFVITDGSSSDVVSHGSLITFEDGIIKDNSGKGRAGFRLLLANEDSLITLEDGIPKDISGEGRVGSRLLPVTVEDDFVVVGDVDSTSSIEDSLIAIEDGIPKDSSSKGRAGFRLLPSNIDDGFVITDVSTDDEIYYDDDGLISVVGGIPHDNSGEGRAGFKLPIFQTGIPRDLSGKNESGFKILLANNNKDDLAVVIEAGEGRNGDFSDDIPLDRSNPDKAGFRLPRNLEKDLGYVREVFDDLVIVA